MLRKNSLKLLPITLVLLFLVACGGGGDDATLNNDPATYEVESSIMEPLGNSISQVNQSGPVANTTVTVVTGEYSVDVNVISVLNPVLNKGDT